jgi:hypothetical protein
MFSPTAFLTAGEPGQYAAPARSGKPSGSPDLAFKDTYTAAYPDERGGALMGWLDKLLGRDKEDAGEPAGTSTSVESDVDAAGAADDVDPHAGHDHPPGEHPHEEQP